MFAAPLYFCGTAFVAAGIFLLCLCYGLAARSIHEQKHTMGRRSGCVLCILLTCYVAACCTVVIVAHSRDSAHFCNVLESALGGLTPIQTPD